MYALHRHWFCCVVILAATSSAWASGDRSGPAHVNLPPRPVTPSGLENLIAFTRLLGYMRYFDPADAASATDWSALAIAAIDSVEGARSPDELAGMLRRAFGPLDPVMRVDTRRVAIDTTLLRDHAPPDSIITWTHHGYGPGNPTSSVYWSRRQYHSVDDVLVRPGPARAIARDIGGGVWCAVPLSLWADAGGTRPRARAAWTPRPRSAGFMPTGDDRSTRLADVALLWNVIQHFFPYFDVVDANWDAALRDAMREAAIDTTAIAFRVTLQRMMAHLDDGHVSVSGPGDEGFALPFAWSFVEGRVVVTWAPDSTGPGVRRGDIVRAVDGVPVETRYAALLPRISAATEGWRHFRALQMLAGPARDSLQLEVERANGGPREVTVRPGVPPPRGAGRPAPIAELRRGIWYVDVSRASDSTFAAAVDTLAHARGVIFDVRGYPSVGVSPLAHLADSTMTSERWCVPNVSAPDHRGMEFEFSDWSFPPEQPRFRGRIAFLISGRAISYSETWLSIAEHYQLGAFVGEPTAGTNGNVNYQTLPGGYRVVFTGMRVLRHDGSRHHGVGIRPTVPVLQSIAGVRAGTDEQLEKAIEVVGG